MKRILVILILTFGTILSNKINVSAQCASNINHWESCVLDNQPWKYIVPNTAISGWQLPLFNDASWTSGNGGIGYGDGDDNTIVPNNTNTVYMRRSFNIIDTAAISSVVFCMDYDDGFVAYLNGVEIARSNIIGTPTWNSFASTSHEALLYQNQQPDYFTLNTQMIDTILKNGTNVLCIETHNVNANNSDLTSRPFLQLGITNATFNYTPTPAWFTPPSTLYTKLPIMTINTLGQTIVDDPRIICDMGMIYNGPGNMNCLLDPFNNYNGKISIEFRGSSSQGFPKKPYGFSTVNTLGIDSNASLLGMPEENDWVLLNPYTDKTFMRDVIIHDLGRALGWYTSRAQFLELVINGQYQGVYVLLEKIKRDDERVDVSKLTNTMNSGDSLTGGYIFKVDKITGNSGGGWSTTQGVSIQNHDPNWNQVTAQQNSYLQNYINNFESVLWGPNATNPNTGYRKIANVHSFSDFFILNEVSNNIDGYRLSTYIHKDRNSKCGRFTMGPFWDFNLSFGNANYCNGYEYTGWQMYQGCGDGSSKWIDRMLQDQWFKNMLSCRYAELRQTLLSTNSLHARIDTYANYIRQAAVRDSAQWQTIGNYIWPNGWIANSWQGEIDSMKQWITNRMNWIDANMYPTMQPCNSSLNVSLVIDEINFHSDETTDAGDWIELYNHGNTSIDLSNAMILDGDQYEHYCVIPNGTTLAAGARLVIYSDSLAFSTRFPSVTNKIGPLCFKLSNAGQKIVIKDKDNKLIYSVNYFDTWECSTDGNGRTLQLTTPTANPNTFSSWYAGCMGGSPGVAYTACNELLIYSEINYASATSADAGDWIELYNKNTVPINLNGWSIRDGSDNNVFTFNTSYNLLPQNYLVLFNDAAKFSARFPNVNNKIGPIGFGLNSTSDAIRLYDNTGKLRYSVCYKSAAPWPTAPNAGGKTLENGQYNGNHNAATSWFAGCPEGSPGKVYNPACWPASTENIESMIQLVVYPNPANDKLFYTSSVQFLEIKLMDATGKVIRKQLANTNEIDILGLPAGLYILDFKGEKQEHYYLRFVKQ
jgi:hypothetical protein